MLKVIAPDGASFEVPEEPGEDPVHYPGPDDLDQIRSYYEAEGYVVIRNALSQATCDAMRGVFAAEVKPHRGFIYRQASANPERHVLTRYGFMLNSVLNIHAVDPDAFSQFRRQGTDLITSDVMQRIVGAVVQDKLTLVQSMYFEGNPATWAHQDTYYLDSEQLGRMVGAWIALEDIAPDAGRFFIYPKSHLLELDLNRGAFNIATQHDMYKQLILRVIREKGLQCRAPALRKGDVLLWGARTIHGSLKTAETPRSRSSVTAHYIPSSTRFMQWQSRIKPLNLTEVNGMLVHTPKDLASRRNRAVFKIETRFPAAFQTAKRAAVWALTR